MELRSHLSTLIRAAVGGALPAVAAAVLGALSANASAADLPPGTGTVRTTAGATIAGAVSFGPAGLEVKPAAGDPVRVPLEELVELAFADRPDAPPVVPPSSPEAAGAGTNTAPAAAGPASGTPAGWTPRAIGSAPLGRVAVEAGAWTVSGGGAGLRGNSDSAFLVERRLEVSGQLAATLRRFDGTNPEAMAGLILRDNLGDSAAYAFLGQRAGAGICFQYRQIASGMTMRLTNVSVALPAALRLQRLGGSVVAEVSADGRQWTQLGRVNVNLGQSVRAGAVIASGADDTTATAEFLEPTVGAAGAGYAPASGYPRVVLRGGSILIAPVESADESVVRLGGPLPGAVISVLNLARIEFLPVPSEMASRLEPERPGVLLTDGDFLDGTLRQVATNTVTMNSLLFGFRRFTAGSEAAVVQAGAVEPEDATFRVRLRGGSELRARRLTGGTNELRAESPMLGALVVRGDDIRSIRRGGMER